jgi:GNAT superfamily N-acetyltransferase
MQTEKEPQRRYYDLEELFNIDYNISSPLGEIEMGRYIQDITGSIKVYTEDGSQDKEIGSIHAAKVLISNAKKEGEPMVFVWDWEQYLCDMSAEIWDYEEEEFSERITLLSNGELIGEDLLILNFIEIEPEYRGKDLGKHVIKDLYNNFISGCALFIVNFNNYTAYDYLQKKGIDENKTQNYFVKQLGFRKLQRSRNNYLILNPNVENPLFDAITLI